MGASLSTSDSEVGGAGRERRGRGGGVGEGEKEGDTEGEIVWKGGLKKLSVEKEEKFTSHTRQKSQHIQSIQYNMPQG